MVSGAGDPIDDLMTVCPARGGLAYPGTSLHDRVGRFDSLSQGANNNICV